MSRKISARWEQPGAIARRCCLLDRIPTACPRDIRREAIPTDLSGERTDRSKSVLPERFRGPRLWSTAIYYLLPGHEVSRFHRLKADEIWHFYTGSTLTLYVIDLSGALLRETGSRP